MEKWEKRWEENQLRWHKSEVDPLLIKHLTKLKEEEKKCGEGKERRKKFFVPLCGKSLDIPYILSIGYDVFAVEGVKKAIETLDEENNFGLTFSEEDSLYRSGDNRVQIYFGDLFTAPLEKWAPFDYVWDKGSLTAIDEGCRPSYKAAMQRSLQVPGKSEYHDFKYLLRTVIYDKTKSDGKGPKCVSESDMEDLYGDWTIIILLDSVPLPETHVLRKNVDIGLVCHENIYLLTRKQ